MFNILRKPSDICEVSVVGGCDRYTGGAGAAGAAGNCGGGGAGAAGK